MSPHVVLELGLDCLFVPVVGDLFTSTGCFLGADGTSSTAFYGPRFRYIYSCASKLIHKVVFLSCVIVILT
jgi:hypothetical protein